MLLVYQFRLGGSIDTGDACIYISLDDKRVTHKLTHRFPNYDLVSHRPFPFGSDFIQNVYYTKSCSITHTLDTTTELALEWIFLAHNPIRILVYIFNISYVGLKNHDSSKAAPPPSFLVCLAGTIVTNGYHTLTTRHDAHITYGWHARTHTFCAGIICVIEDRAGAMKIRASYNSHMAGYSGWMMSDSLWEVWRSSLNAQDAPKVSSPLCLICGVNKPPLHLLVLGSYTHTI